MNKFVKIIIIETFVKRKIGENPVMHQNPSGDIPKT